MFLKHVEIPRSSLRKDSSSSAATTSALGEFSKSNFGLAISASSLCMATSSTRDEGLLLSRRDEMSQGVILRTFPPSKLLATIPNFMPFFLCVINFSCTKLTLSIWCCVRMEGYIFVGRVAHQKKNNLFGCTHAPHIQPLIAIIFIFSQWLLVHHNGKSSTGKVTKCLHMYVRIVVPLSSASQITSRSLCFST